MRCPYCGNRQAVCGTNSKYMRGCRCPRCKQAHSAATGRWLKARRRKNRLAKLRHGELP